MNNENCALKNYAAKLKTRAEELNQYSLSNWIDMNDIESLPTKGIFVYAIFARNATQVDYILKGLNNCKDSCSSKCTKHGGKKPVKHFSQVNGRDCKDNCIYIGSSEGLRARIRGHFDDKCTGHTFALHLRCYFQDNDLFVKYVSISDRVLMQDVEDALWDYYKPVLGKRGQK